MAVGVGVFVGVGVGVLVDVGVGVGVGCITFMVTERLISPDWATPLIVYTVVVLGQTCLEL